MAVKGQDRHYGVRLNTILWPMATPLCEVISFLNWRVTSHANEGGKKEKKMFSWHVNIQHIDEWYPSWVVAAASACDPFRLLNKPEMLLILTAQFTSGQPLTSLPPSAAILVTDREHWHVGALMAHRWCSWFWNAATGPLWMDGWMEVLVLRAKKLVL